jgi:hypothetical protein
MATPASMVERALEAFGAKAKVPPLLLCWVGRMHNSTHLYAVHSEGPVYSTEILALGVCNVLSK